MTKRALLVGLGSIYFETLSGYKSFNIDKNISRISTRLNISNWNNVDIILEENATKNNIIKCLKEIISNSKEDDIILFYFNGHGDKYKTRMGTDEKEGDDGFDEFFVTYHKKLKIYPKPYDLDLFFTDNDYSQIVESFLVSNPKSNFISIIDCCYAKGFIDKKISALKNHSILASSSSDIESWADINEGSYFTHALNYALNNNQYLKDVEIAIGSYLQSYNHPTPFIDIKDKILSISNLI